MSWLSKYVFDPFLATLARAAGSSHAGTAAAGKAALGAVAGLGADVAASLQNGLTVNSAQAAGNVALKDAEDGLRATVDAYLTAALPIGVGEAAAQIANGGLDWVEQHVHDYVASLFHHARQQAAAPPAPPNQGLQIG